MIPVETPETGIGQLAATGRQPVAVDDEFGNARPAGPATQPGGPCPCSPDPAAPRITPRAIAAAEAWHTAPRRS